MGCVLGGVLQDALDDEFEAEGTISGWDMMNQFTLNLANGATLAVQVADGAEIPGSGIADGLFVEVEGTVPDPGRQVNDAPTVSTGILPFTVVTTIVWVVLLPAASVAVTSTT